MNEDIILNLNSKDFNKMLDDKTAVICINYTVDEFNNIMIEMQT